MGKQLTDIQRKEKADIQKRLGNKLARMRADRNITQENLAFDLEVDRTYISYIERGERNPSLYMLWRLAKALKVNLKELTSI